MNDWILLGHRADLATPGDYIRIPIDGSEMVAYNDAGNIVVNDGLCPHRGTQIFTGTHGNAPMTCPYHGWSFRNGQTNVPCRENYSEAELEKAKFHQYMTCWVGDWLFASTGELGYPVPEGNIRSILESIKINKRHSVDAFPMSCDWRVAVENTLEDMHIPTVHRDTFGKVNLKRIDMQREGPHSIALYEITDKRTLELTDRLSKSFSNVKPNEYFHLYLSPYACLSSLGGFTYSLQHYLPSGGWTSFTSRLYTGSQRPDAPDMKWFYEEARTFNHMVFQQDAEICSRVKDWGHALSTDEERVRWFRESTGTYDSGWKST